MIGIVQNGDCFSYEDFFSHYILANLYPKALSRLARVVNKNWVDQLGKQFFLAHSSIKTQTNKKL